MNPPDDFDISNVPKLRFPAPFWDEVRNRSPDTAYLCGIVGTIMVIVGTPLDLARLSGKEALGAALFRAACIAYLIVLSVVSKRRPHILIKHYGKFVAGLLLLVSGSFSYIGAWVPGGFGNLYFVALLEVQLAIFIFLPLPARILAPAILLSNGLFLGVGIAAGNPADDAFATLVTTLAVFMVLGFGVQHATLRTRFRAYLSHQRAVALAQQQTQRGDLLEEAVLLRTRELHRAYETLKQQSQERLAAERALREAESRYRKTIENTVSLVFEVTGDDVVTLVRAPQEWLLDRPVEEIDGQKLLDGLHADDRKAFFSLLALCRSDFQSRRIRTRLRYEEGPWHWFEWACSFYQSADGTPIGVLLARDMTQELRLQKEVERQSRLAAIGQLAAGITHDFNNLLVGVRLGIDAAFAAGPLPKEAGEHLRRAADSAQRARSIIRRILDFSKRSPSLPAPVDLSAFVRECGTFLRHMLTDEVAIEISADEPAWVYVDASQLEQAIVNLAVNAKDAMPGGGVLGLRVERLEAAVRLYVSDTGEGMSEEAMAHLFEPFFSTKGEHGTGLGLAQVYGLLRQNSGAIWVDSELERGTCFTIEFPRLEAPKPLAPVVSTAALTEEQTVPPWRILLVEDDADLRRLFEVMLANLGAYPIVAASAREALQVLDGSETPFDLLVTDQSMPGMSGRDLALAVRARQPAMKVLLITGLLSEERPLDLEPPFDGVLLKPFDVNDLRQALLELAESTSPAKS